MLAKLHVRKWEITLTCNGEVSKIWPDEDRIGIQRTLSKIMRVYWEEDMTIVIKRIK
jgi:hypothetical protein